MKKLLILSALVFTLFIIAACGDGKESGQTGTGETGTVTQEGCTTRHSFGTNSFIRDAGDICADKIAGERCYANSTGEEIAEKIAKAEKFKLVFHRESCEYYEIASDPEKIQQVECPDFIPQSMKLEKLTGCEYFTVDPHTECAVDCPHFYFSTDNDFFRNITYISSDSSEELYEELKAESIDGSVYFHSVTYSHASHGKHFFTVMEKTEDGSYRTKGWYYISMDVVDYGTGGEEEEEHD